MINAIAIAIGSSKSLALQPPVATAAIGIGATSFTATWNSYAGASFYLLDVSTNSSFTTFLAGYENFIVVVTGVGPTQTQTITGLTPGVYYYRVRAALQVDIDNYAFMSRVYTAGGQMTYTEATATDQLVTDLKSYGLWSKIKNAYPIVGIPRNILSYTTDFSSMYWGLQNITLALNAGIAPDGTNTAMQLTKTTGPFTVSRVFTTDAVYGIKRTYTLTAYVKNVAATLAEIRMDSAGNSCTVVFNFSTNTTSISGANAISASSTSVGNGWYRIVFVGSPEYYNAPDFTCYYGGSAGETYLIWGPQIEVGSTASTYLPVVAGRTALSTSAASKDIKTITSVTFSSGWRYYSTGILPDGTSAYANTNTVPSVVLSLYSASLSYYSRTNTAGATAKSEYSCADNAYLPLIQLAVRRLENGSTDQFVNQLYSYVSTEGRVYVNNTDSRGFYTISRTSSTLNKSYKNGILQGSSTDVSRANQPTVQLYLGALNANGTAQDYSDRECAFACLSDGLSDTEVANLNLIIQAFQTSLNRQV